MILAVDLEASYYTRQVWAASSTQRHIIRISKDNIITQDNIGKQKMKKKKKTGGGLRRRHHGNWYKSRGTFQWIWGEMAYNNRAPHTRHPSPWLVLNTLTWKFSFFAVEKKSNERKDEIVNRSAQHRQKPEKKETNKKKNNNKTLCVCVSSCWW